MDVHADRFPLVDSLRALAAISIVLFHAAFFAGSLDEGGALAAVATNFQVGVPIFFLISGFLLYRPFTRARLRGDRGPRTAAYAWRRFLRIVPAYWVVLGLAAALGLAVAFSASKAPAYFGFAQTYSVSTYAGGLPQAWTLCVEAAFYVLLPVWALAMRALPARGTTVWLRQELAALALLFAASVAYKVVLALTTDLNSFEAQPLMMALPNFLDQFAIGMALAVIAVWREERGSDPGAVRLLDAHSWIPWAAALGAFALVALVGPTGRIGDGITRTDFLVRHELWTACALGVVLPAMLGDPRRGAVRGLLSRRTLLWLGLVSYGIFLTHYPFMAQLEEWGVEGLAAFVLAGVAGSVVLAAISYYAVERPALSLKGLVKARTEEAPGEATAEAAPLGPPAPERSPARR